MEHRNTQPVLAIFRQQFLWKAGGLAAENQEGKLGARISDEVQFDPARERLEISSCRPKPWTLLTTISHEGQFYEMVSEQKTGAPRPFVYHLRKKPPTAVIRGICPYDPNEALEISS